MSWSYADNAMKRSCGGWTFKNTGNPLLRTCLLCPTVEDDAVIQKALDDLNTLYTTIQDTPCPDAADDVYTELVRAIMSLRQTFEAVSQLNFPEAEYTYEQLQSAYDSVYAGLEEIGIYGY